MTRQLLLPFQKPTRSKVDRADARLVKAMKENYTAALLDYNRAIALKSDFAEAYTNRAVLYMAMFRDNDSRADYLRAIKLKPEMREQLDALIDRARRLRRH